MASLPLPFSLTTRCRPTVPPAPGRLKTWTEPVIFCASSTCADRAGGRVVAAAGGVGDHDLQAVGGLRVAGSGRRGAGVILGGGAAATEHQGGDGDRRGGSDRHATTGVEDAHR